MKRKNKIVLNCEFCGKPISQSTDFGMTCEDECHQKKWEKENGRPFIVDDEIDNFFNSNKGFLSSMFNSFSGQDNLGGQLLKEKGNAEIIVNELINNFKNYK